MGEFALPSVRYRVLFAITGEPTEYRMPSPAHAARFIVDMAQGYGLSLEHAAEVFAFQRVDQALGDREWTEWTDDLEQDIFTAFASYFAGLPREDAEPDSSEV